MPTVTTRGPEVFRVVVDPRPKAPVPFDSA